MLEDSWRKLIKCPVCNFSPSYRLLKDNREIVAVHCCNPKCKAKYREYPVKDWQAKGISLLM